MLCLVCFGLEFLWRGWISKPRLPIYFHEFSTIYTLNVQNVDMLDYLHAVCLLVVVEEGLEIRLHEAKFEVKLKLPGCKMCGGMAETQISAKGLPYIL